MAFDHRGYPLNGYIKRVVDARESRIRMIHLGFASWDIERNALLECVCAGSGIITDLSGIVADYNGSAHGRAIDIIHDSHKHLFTSKFESVATGEECISFGELSNNLDDVIANVGYRNTIMSCSVYWPNDVEVRWIVRDLFYKIIDEHSRMRDYSPHYITDMFYHIILLCWPNHAATM